MRRQLIGLACVGALLTSGCAAGESSATPRPTPSATPSPSPGPPATREQALAVLRTGPTSGWATDASGFGPKPPTPAGFSQEVLDDVYADAVRWLEKANLERKVWEGDTEAWASAVDPTRATDWREVVTTPEAFAYVTVFAPGARVLEARTKGAFTASVGEYDDGQEALEITWRGTIVYAVLTGSGTASLVPVHREATWDGWDGVGTGVVSAEASAGNLVQCESLRTNRLVPARGTLEVEPGWLLAEARPEPTEEEQAELDAELAAC